MFDSARDMDLFYEESREAAFKFKNLFDEIRQTQQLNDALRHVYYDALATKKKHEGDRDQYFLVRKNLWRCSTKKSCSSHLANWLHIQNMSNRLLYYFVALFIFFEVTI